MVSKRWRSVLWREKVGVRLAHDLCWIAQSTTFCVRPANTHKTAVEILEVDIVGDIFQEGIQELPFCPKVPVSLRHHDRQQENEERDRDNSRKRQGRGVYAVGRIPMD